jgi:hypothetical protein
LSGATASTLADDAVTAGAGASGPEDAHAPMNIEIVTTRIRPIIVSPKLGSEPVSDSRSHDKPRQTALSITKDAVTVQDVTQKNTRSELRVFCLKAQTIYTVSGVAPPAQGRPSS